MPATTDNHPLSASCGSWKSPITVELLTRQAVRLGTAHIDDDGTVFWVEGRPEEGGRNVLVRWRPDNAGGTRSDVTPAPFNVRTTVHEYGGGAYTVDQGELWFADHPGNRLCHVDRNGQITTLIGPDCPWRMADLQVDRVRGRLVCVGERHQDEGHHPQNALISVPLSGGMPQPLITGADFYSSPRLSPDGARMAWMQWNHPDMPWDGAALFIADLDDKGLPGVPVLVAGDANASVFGPGFLANGDLVFMFEPEGFWNPHILPVGQRQARPLLTMPAEFALPHWQFNMSTWQPCGPNRIACAYTTEGRWNVALVDTRTGALDPLATPLTVVSDLRAADNQVVLVGAAHDLAPAIHRIDTTTGQTKVLRQSLVVDQNLHPFLSAPQPLTFATSEGETAHGFWYAPRNPGFAVPDGEKPPLLVMIHGGPTAAAGCGLNLSVQYWTSRGFAVLDLNHRGSTGYGRRYRDRLRGQWGVLDIDDCVAGARALVDAGQVDERRLAIRGGSAGGYTALAALTFRDVFRAGAILYGISDLEALARDTHKFEAHYTDRLIAPYPARADVYRERSPLFSIDRLSAPVIFFQGLEDKVVPPSQAETMVNAVAAKGIPCAYLAFPGEQHGFRRAETIQRVLQAELCFYGHVFGFTPADAVVPFPIRNLDAVQSTRA